MGLDKGGQTIWNMDAQVNMRIDQLINLCEEKFHQNNLEGVYWELRAVKRNMVAKLKPKEEENVTNMFKDLENRRSNWGQRKGRDNGAFFMALENCFEILNKLMKKHGMFFREESSAETAVLG